MVPHWGLQYPSPAPSGEDTGAAELPLLPNVPGQATSLGRDQRRCQVDHPPLPPILCARTESVAERGRVRLTPSRVNITVPSCPLPSPNRMNALAILVQKMSASDPELEESCDDVSVTIHFRSPRMRRLRRLGEAPHVPGKGPGPTPVARTARNMDSY